MTCAEIRRWARLKKGTADKKWRTAMDKVVPADLAAARASSTLARNQSSTNDILKIALRFDFQP